MNKIEFIDKLEKKLKYLPKEDREDAISYYKEYLEDMGVSESEDVTDKLGNPSEIAAGIIAECTEKKIEENKNEKKVKNSTQIIWLVVIAVCSIPILIPVAIVLFMIILVVLTIALCLMISAVLSVIPVIFIPGIGQKLVCLGVSCIFFAIGLLMTIFCVELARLFIILIIKLVKYIVKKEK